MQCPRFQESTFIFQAQYVIKVWETFTEHLFQRIHPMETVVVTLTLVRSFLAFSSLSISTFWALAGRTRHKCA